MTSSFWYRLGGVGILAATAAWGGYALVADAPVVDEAPHLAAGISYVQLLDYRLNPEHPPLEKLAAGLVAQFAHPTLPTDAPWWQTGINEQWRAGTAVLWDGRNDPGSILALGRLGVLLLNLCILALLWRIAARSWHEGWALALLALVATSPFFLGHAHLITTDVTAAGMAVLACIAFARFMRTPTWRYVFLAGITLGIAQLAKFSLVLLPPTFVFSYLWIVWYEHRWNWRILLRSLQRPLAVMVVAYACVVYPTYALLTLREPLERSHTDATFLLSSFAGGSPKGLLCNPLRCVAELTVLGSTHYLTRPLATYTLGVLMVIQRSAGGNTIYFNNTVGSSGSKAYFPLVYATKETLPALAIVGIGLALLIRTRRRGGYDLFTHVTPELILGIFALLYTLSTLRSSLNIGVRHIFPLIGIVYVFALDGWRRASVDTPRLQHIAIALVTLHMVTGLSSLPYPLAYYNFLGGTTMRGYAIATDSNYDWGQDALRLRQWLDTHPDAHIAVDLFGGSDARALLGSRATNWNAQYGNPQAFGITYLAVSINTLLTATGPLQPGEPRELVDEYRWLQALRGTPYGTLPEPDERIGTSIFLYKLSTE